jgi:hypothetical protein
MVVFKNNVQVYNLWLLKNGSKFDKEELKSRNEQPGVTVTL